MKEFFLMLRGPVQRSVRRVWVHECETNGLWHEETANCRHVKWLHASISEVNSFMAVCPFCRNAQSNTSTASLPNSLKHKRNIHHCTETIISIELYCSGQVLVENIGVFFRKLKENIRTSFVLLKPSLFGVNISYWKRQNSKQVYHIYANFTTYSESALNFSAMLSYMLLSRASKAMER